MYSNIAEHLITTNDARLLKEELELLQGTFFKTAKQSFNDVLKNQVRSWVADAIQELSKTKKNDQSKIIADLLDDLNKYQVIELILAFDPSQALLQRIRSWLDGKQLENALLELKYDPSVLGGAIISYQGRYQDFSVRKAIQEYIQKKQPTS